MPVGQLNYEIIPSVKVEAVVFVYYSICQDCNLIFQNPRLSDIELDKFYSTGYYRRTIKDTDDEADEGEEFRAKTDATIIMNHIKDVRSHLDIGCSRGYLLDAVGANIKVGVDTNVDNFKISGVKIYTKMNQVPRKPFNLVTAIHVLEHVSKPLDYLRSMVNFTGKNGYLVIEVPTWKSPGGPLRFAHLYHFEPDVLRQLCIQAGLCVIHEELTPHLIFICQLNR